MRILWAGPYFSEKAFIEKRGLNIASTIWSHGFVHGLLENGCDVQIVTLCPEQAWPRGKVFWQSKDMDLFDHDVPVTAIPYLNIAYIREKWQNIFFARAVKRILSGEKYDAFVCYNALHPYHVAAMKTARNMGVKVYPIILDGGYDVEKNGLEKMSFESRFADGVVFLSQWCKDNFPANGRRLLQMEGGVESWLGKKPIENKEKANKIVTYAGAFTAHRGQGLVDMIKSCKRNDVRFIICGKWDFEKAKKALDGDSRVDLRGMVSSEELEKIYSQTDIFINSREAKWGHNLANFPSKVLAYMAYGRPIVSNWVASMPSEYKDILCVADNDSGQSLAHKLEEILDWSLAERINCYEKLYSVYNNTKSWKIQAHKFLDFIKEA